MCEDEAKFHRFLLEKETVTMPRECQRSTIKVSVSAKDEVWTFEEPLPRIQEWNPDLRQITQVSDSEFKCNVLN